MRKPLLFLLISTTLCLAQTKPIILWDLHGVFFNQHNFAKTWLIGQLITHISWPFIHDLYTYWHYQYRISPA